MTAAAVVLPWGLWAAHRLGRDPDHVRATDRLLTGAGVLALAMAGHALGRHLVPR